jgi:hypothetical protein
MNFGFTYAGTVENNKDPLKLGRVKVRVPHVYGSSATGSGYIATNDLPWALPAGLPAGGSSASGGFSQLPATGDKVWVRFLDGEPEKPIWEWGMQSVDDRDNLKLHSYDIGTPVGAPNRAFWTRYGQAIEINEGSIIITTSQGYRMVLLDASDAASQDGKITITTQLGNMIELDDLDSTIKVTVLEDMYFTIINDLIGSSNNFTWETMSGDFTLTAGGGFSLSTVDNVDITTVSDIIADALGNVDITTVGDMTLGFTNLSLGLAATEPAVLGTQLLTYLELLLTIYDTHTHTSSLPGTPTSPPTVPGPVVPPTILSETVLVQN